MLIVTAWSVHRCGIRTLRCAFVALCNSHPIWSTKEWSPSNVYLACIFMGNIMCLIILMMWELVTSESMKPRPYFQALNHHLSHFCHLFACYHFYYRITKSPFTIHITCLLPSLRQTIAHIQLTIVLEVFGTQEIYCILIAWPFERRQFQHVPPVDSINLRTFT